MTDILTRLARWWLESQGEVVVRNVNGVLEVVSDYIRDIPLHVLKQDVQDRFSHVFISNQDMEAHLRANGWYRDVRRDPELGWYVPQFTAAVAPRELVAVEAGRAIYRLQPSGKEHSIKVKSFWSWVSEAEAVRAETREVEPTSGAESSSLPGLPPEPKRPIMSMTPMMD